MIPTIVFSRDRPAQLDLLLTSIEQRAPNLLEPHYVLFCATTPEYLEGYEICETDHRDVCFVTERDFQDDLEELMDDLASADGGSICFLCDDDLVTRDCDTWPNPDLVLAEYPNALCFSLRLGSNTTMCYPLRRNQETPPWVVALRGLHVWRWVSADSDWGYPGSLDGHIFRRNMLRAFLMGERYGNPNQLEEILVDYCRSCVDTFPLMASYDTSLITGIPVNRVNETHPNRAGDYYPIEPQLLNATYLGGKRLALVDTDPGLITGAHTELPLVFA